MTASTVPLDRDPPSLSDLLAEALGQVRLELAPEREPQANAVQGEVHGGDSPRVGVAPSIQSLQHRRLWQRVKAALVRHGEKMLANSAPLNGFAMRRVQRHHVRDTAALYRALASQKKLAAALGLDQANASRLVNGVTPSPAARFAQDLERLVESGIDPAPLLIYVDRIVRDARVAYLDREHPYLKRA